MERQHPCADCDARGVQRDAVALAARHASTSAPIVKRRLAGPGADRLVKRLTRSLPTLANVVLGPGDDCAVIGGPRDRVWQLLKTDCVIEGVHFTRDTDPKRVGWKALCRAISDIAAMGGEPT